MVEVYTMRQAALALGIGRTNLQRLIKRYPFYYKNGHRKLFTPTDVERLRDAMRTETCRSNSYRQRRAATRTTASVERTSGCTWTDLQRRLSERRRQGCSPSGAQKSTAAH